MQNLCPVCGYEMAEAPANYNICPSCGTEFGHHDVNASIEDLRIAWYRTGPSWWSKTEPQPANWNPFEQLSRLNASRFFSARSFVKSGAATEFKESYSPAVPPAQSSDRVLGKAS